MSLHQRISIVGGGTSAWNEKYSKTRPLWPQGTYGKVKSDAKTRRNAEPTTRATSKMTIDEM